MIIVKLMGNLGNQLFIYAFARSLEIRTNEKVVFDLSGLKRYYYTASLQLDNYQIPKSFLFELDTLPLDIKKRFERWTQLFHFEQKIDKTFHHSQDTSNFLVQKWSKRGCYFDFSGFRYRSYSVAKVPFTFVYGYFQSRFYFDEFRPYLLDDLVLKDSFDAEETQLIKEIENCNSVGVSIRTRFDRRGDSFVEYDYYLRGMQLLAKQIKNPRFFIFSDDVEKAKREIHFNFPVIFVNQKNACRQLCVLSHCKNFVLANSTFSWWGAYLSNYLEKKIVMPSPWFKGLESHDIYLEGAQTIPCSFEK